MRNIITTSLVALFCGLCCSTAQRAVADTTVPACTVADINQALTGALSCSTAGTVFFGTDITQFVLNQCSTVSTPGQSSSVTKANQEACIKCAKRSVDAFASVVKAGLVKVTSSSKLNVSKIKSLCSVTDSTSGSGSAEPPESDALKNMFNQLHLCLPNSTQAIDATQCVQCATTVLDSALSSGVLNQTKYAVIKSSVQQVCAHQGSGEPHTTPSPGEPHTSPSPGATPGEPHTSPSPKPSLDPGKAAYEQYLNGLRGCFNQFHNKGHFDAVGCVACVNGVATTGVDASLATPALSYAVGICQAPLGDTGKK